MLISYAPPTSASLFWLLYYPGPGNFQEQTEINQDHYTSTHFVSSTQLLSPLQKTIQIKNVIISFIASYCLIKHSMLSK